MQSLDTTSSEELESRRKICSLFGNTLTDQESEDLIASYIDNIARNHHTLIARDELIAHLPEHFRERGFGCAVACLGQSVRAYQDHLKKQLSSAAILLHERNGQQFDEMYKKRLRVLTPLHFHNLIKQNFEPSLHSPHAEIATVLFETSLALSDEKISRQLLSVAMQECQTTDEKSDLIARFIETFPHVPTTPECVVAAITKDPSMDERLSLLEVAICHASAERYDFIGRQPMDHKTKARIIHAALDYWHDFFPAAFTDDDVARFLNVVADHFEAHDLETINHIESMAFMPIPLKIASRIGFRKATLENQMLHDFQQQLSGTDTLPDHWTL